MAFVKIENNVVVQKSYSASAGFIEAPDDVVCGQIQTANGFINPPPIPKTPDELMRAEMPTVQEQLDALLAGGKAASDMKTKIDAIKAKFIP